MLPTPLKVKVLDRLHEEAGPLECVYLVYYPGVFL